MRGEITIAIGALSIFASCSGQSFSGSADCPFSYTEDGYHECHYECWLAAEECHLACYDG
jgi:hypothetical protein